MLWDRIKGKYQRTLSRVLARREFRMPASVPMISFTFDDFPRSALLTAGKILEQHGIAGTYYTSFGLMGKLAPTGKIFGRDDLPLVFEQGHELGCHTFAHCHSTQTPGGLFEQSIIENRVALGSLCPGAEFKSLSYPIGCPNPEVKRRSGRHFVGCREGGQTHNAGVIDLNRLQAFFIEQSRDDFSAIQRAVQENHAAQGWLIFATHDVCPNPTPFGCVPSLFEQIVKYAVASGAQIVPVSVALARIGAAAPVPTASPHAL